MKIFLHQVFNKSWKINIFFEIFNSITQILKYISTSRKLFVAFEVIQIMYNKKK